MLEPDVSLKAVGVVDDEAAVRAGGRLGPQLIVPRSGLAVVAAANVFPELSLAFRNERAPRLQAGIHVPPLHVLRQGRLLYRLEVAVRAGKPRVAHYHMPTQH